MFVVGEIDDSKRALSNLVKANKYRFVVWLGLSEKLRFARKNLYKLIFH